MQLSQGRIVRTGVTRELLQNYRLYFLQFYGSQLRNSHDLQKFLYFKKHSLPTFPTLLSNHAFWLYWIQTAFWIKKAIDSRRLRSGCMYKQRLFQLFLFHYAFSKKIWLNAGQISKRNFVKSFFKGNLRRITFIKMRKNAPRITQKASSLLLFYNAPFRLSICKYFHLRDTSNRVKQDCHGRSSDH